MAVKNQWSGVLKLQRRICDLSVVYVSSQCGAVQRREFMDRAFQKLLKNRFETYVQARINPNGLLIVESKANPSIEW